MVAALLAPGMASAPFVFLAPPLPSSGSLLHSRAATSSFASNASRWSRKGHRHLPLRHLDGHRPRRLGRKQPFPRRRSRTTSAGTSCKYLHAAPHPDSQHLLSDELPSRLPLAAFHLD
ncbi:hypothetical protein MUK42_35064 [Musa troglodytarum]|uniref:Uncharacterized protein n=1 Tax=Musa troglodytarum TaxID=320322 RepID=A0A9E7L0S3_9LILI|nr:hypothetical protein MUK42_35064 [Musa troglodytarum]